MLNCSSPPTGHAADAKAPSQTDNRKTEEQRSRIKLAPVESLGEKRTAHAPDDDGQESPEFEDAVAPRKLFRRKHFRQQSVFGRPEECSLRADKKDCRQRQFQIGSHEGRGGEHHDPHFKYFRPDGDGAFAEPVRQISARQRKENERGREEHADKQFELVTMCLIFFDRKNEVDNEKFEGILVEGALELSGDQAPKTEPPLFSGRRYGEVFVGRHACSPKRCD